MIIRNLLLTNSRTSGKTFVILLMMLAGIFFCCSPGSEGATDSTEITESTETKPTTVFEALGIKAELPAGWNVALGNEGYTCASPDQSIKIMVSRDEDYTFDQYVQNLPSGIKVTEEVMMQSIGKVKLLKPQKAYAQIKVGNIQESKNMWVAMWQTKSKGLITFVMMTEDAAKLNAGKDILMQMLSSAGEIGENTPKTLVKTEGKNNAKKPPHTESPGKPTSELLKGWYDKLSPSRLTYMSSYSSGSSGGMSSQTVIHLCSNRSFMMYGQSSLSIGTDGANASSGGNEEISGKWHLREQNDFAILVLVPDKSEKREFQLQYIDGKLHLNGERFYITFKGDERYAPQCD